MTAESFIGGRTAGDPFPRAQQLDSDGYERAIPEGAAS